MVFLIIKEGLGTSQPLVGFLWWKPEISVGLMGHQAHTQTLSFYLTRENRKKKAKQLEEDHTQDIDQEEEEEEIEENEEDKVRR